MIGGPGYECATIPEDDIRWLLPPDGRPDGKVVCLDDKILHPQQRTLHYYEAAQDDFVALQYQENGHVTLPSTDIPRH